MDSEPISIQAKNAIGKQKSSFILNTPFLKEEDVKNLADILGNRMIESFEIHFNSCDQGSFSQFKFLSQIKKTFTISGPIDDKGIKNLLEGHDKVLFKKLSLTKSSITSNGLNVLQIFLLSNNSITGLDISENGLTDKDAEIICNITQTSPSLNELWLKKNKLTKTGVSQILDGLKDNNTLEFLDLSLIDLA